MAVLQVSGYEVASPDMRTGPEPQVVDLGHTLGRQVVIWTPDTDADINRVLGLGVDGIISDRPARVFALR